MTQECPKTLEIQGQTYIRSDTAPVPVTGSAYDRFVGKRVLVRTATYFIDGTLTGVAKDGLVMRDVATVFSIGNQTNLQTGSWAESERHPPGESVISLGAIIDVSVVG